MKIDLTYINELILHECIQYHKRPSFLAKVPQGKHLTEKMVWSYHACNFVALLTVISEFVDDLYKKRGLHNLIFDSYGALTTACDKI